MCIDIQISHISRLLVSFVLRKGVICKPRWKDRNINITHTTWTNSFHSLPSDRSLTSSKNSFSTHCNLVLPLSISSIISFHFWSSSSCVSPLPRLRVTSIFPCNLPLITCLEGSSYAWYGQSIQPSFLLHYVEYNLSSLTLCNSSFFTRSFQLIFSILLHHHIKELLRYLWYTGWA